MKNFKRYDFPKGDLSKDNDVKELDIVAGKGVPKEFLETKARSMMNKFIKRSGIIALTLLAAIPIILFMHVVTPYPSWLIFYFKIGLIALAGFIHLGLFIEAGANHTETNYFAMSAGIFWLYFIVTCIIMMIGYAAH